MGIIRTTCYLLTLTFFCQEEPCSPNPCRNDGECSADGTDFTCSCKPLYSGKQCEIDVCKPRFGFDWRYREINTGMSVCNISDEKEDWSYTGITTGPSEWGKSYPTCNGQSQSPITIINSTVEKDDNLEPLEMTNYDQKLTKAELFNNGHTLTVTPQDDVERSISIDGSTYKLTQMDFHVGFPVVRGSEHRINCTAYPMEVQYMHKNDNDDIAIVAVLFAEYGRNYGLVPIVDLLPDIKYKDQKTQLKDPLDLTRLLPERPFSIFRYTGSLTAPPCTEGVIWSVATDTVDLGYNQRIAFRNLYSVVKQDEGDGCRMNDNYRPVQPLNGRTVTRSK